MALTPRQNRTSDVAVGMRVCPLSVPASPERVRYVYFLLAEKLMI